MKLKNTGLYIFFGLLAYMPLHIFLSTWIGTSFGVLEEAKILKDIVLVFGFMAALAVSTKNILRSLIKNRLVQLIASFATLNVLLALIRPTDQDAEILGIVYNTRFLLFFLYALLLTYLYKPGWLVKRSVQIVLSTAVLVSVFGFVQYFVLPDTALQHVGYSRENGVLPAFFIDDKPDLERIMSTVRDPNSYGSYLIAIISLALAYVLKQKNRQVQKVLYGVLGLAAINLFLTFSRSAWIGAALAILSVVWLHLGPRKIKNFTANNYKKMLVLILVIILALIPIWNSYYVQNVIFHADSSTSLEDPNELRIRFLQESVEDIAEHPLGSGPGTAGLASIRNDIQGTTLNENYYLQTAQELGLLGLVVFMFVLVMVGASLYGVNSMVAIGVFAAFVGLSFTNLLVHIWANEAVAYTFWGLAGVIYGHGNFRKRTPKSRKL